ncbi:MAG: hypothetical protein V4588_03845, partial [Pseudomonadota bacterium]
HLLETNLVHYFVWRTIHKSLYIPGNITRNGAMRSAGRNSRRVEGYQKNTGSRQFFCLKIVRQILRDYQHFQHG